MSLWDIEGGDKNLVAPFLLARPAWRYTRVSGTRMCSCVLSHLLSRVLFAVKHLSRNTSFIGVKRSLVMLFIGISFVFPF